jgi:hypothetical protein
MSPATPPQLLALKQPPPGDYDTWTEEERFNAEHHCYCFAQEYMVDSNAAQAAMRLGFPVKDCGNVGSNYITHWLTHQYLKELRRSFLQREYATKDTVAALIYRDASNFSDKANPQARVAAQKLLVGVLDMAAPKKVEKTVTNTNPATHIMVVPQAQSAEEWEAVTMAKQRKLKEDARK